MSAATKTPSSGVSLNQAARLLKDLLGDDAPSRITLHRHSHGDGAQLSHLICRRTSSRDFFDIQGLASYYRSQVPARPRPGSTALVPSGNVQPPAELPLEEIRNEVRLAVRESMAPLLDMVQRIDRGLSDLSSTRSALMLKYDAGNSHLSQRLEAAETEVARLRNESHSEQILMRMRTDISRMHDAISAMTAAERDK